MKKLIITNLVAFAYFFLAAAQPVINYQAHALKGGINNPMSYCAYTNPGQHGANISWDFQALVFEKDFVGYLNNVQNSAQLPSFPDANAELAEFDSRFYFKITEEKIEQYGYSSANGSARLDYTVPFVKMKYPFTYGDSYSGSFSGFYSSSGVQYAEMTGTYNVEADAYGTLLLPGDVRYDDVIRIRTSKIYTNKYQNADENVEMVTYRWYNASHRYPLLVLTRYTTKSSTSESTNYQAAYNNRAINIRKSATPLLSKAKMSLYPNPARSNLTLQVDAVNTGLISFNIYNTSGKIVRTFEREIFLTGIQDIDLSDEISGLMPAPYILRIASGNDQLIFEFTLIN